MATYSEFSHLKMVELSIVMFMLVYQRVTSTQNNTQISDTKSLTSFSWRRMQKDCEIGSKANGQGELSC